MLSPQPPFPLRSTVGLYHMQAKRRASNYRQQPLKLWCKTSLPIMGYAIKVIGSCLASPWLKAIQSSFVFKCTSVSPARKKVVQQARVCCLPAEFKRRGQVPPELQLCVVESPHVGAKDWNYVLHRSNCPHTHWTMVSKQPIPMSTLHILM